MDGEDWRAGVGVWLEARRAAVAAGRRNGEVVSLALATAAACSDRAAGVDLAGAWTVGLDAEALAEAIGPAWEAVLRARTARSGPRRLHLADLALAAEALARRLAVDELVPWGGGMVEGWRVTVDGGAVHQWRSSAPLARDEAVVCGVVCRAAGIVGVIGASAWRAGESGPQAGRSPAEWRGRSRSAAAVAEAWVPLLASSLQRVEPVVEGLHGV